MDVPIDALLVRRIVEAALLASHHPLTVAQLVELFADAPPPPGSIERALQALREASDERGIELVEVASGFRFQVRGDLQPWIARLWSERQTRYSRALLETLALIAYRQPITRGEIEQIRGVAVSTNIIKTLEEREWVRVVGHRDVPGKPALFGTTRTFLDYFGLKSLDQLPPLAELSELPDLEPQLPLDGAVALPAPPVDADATPSAAIDPAHAAPIGSEADAEADAETGADDAATPEAVEPPGPDRNNPGIATVDPPDTDASIDVDPGAATRPSDPPDPTDSTEDDAINASSEQNA